MSIQNAISFVDIFKNEEKLRNYLMSLNSSDEVRAYLKELGLEFTDEEFEEAYNLLLLRCRDEADHSVLNQVKMSYIVLVTGH
ncbi:MAG: Nif11-like leader peptide family natural product precursor [Prolixibacteraceae bacterium]|jgi:predicted ribosomally synthesized peptide with nif11-like leader|nr:Nif11-like leader peptide family natural product precursor [Prolixibacteraceae bacterium]